ncbi:o-succinylbenzoate--CoA ligase [Georgenia sp. Z1344]|uniref:o-succinylbenzoate--CoA ligase n=1 Tax=Georgenia sp. Z1344 TaxID=3416706 RepID=UPI003CEB60E4
MRDAGVGSWPARQVRATPDKTAILFEGAELSYRELHRRSVRLAHALRARGVRHGDRVAYLGPNHPALAETFFAVTMLGAVIVPLNVRLAPSEHSYVLSDSRAQVIIHDGDLRETVAALDDDLPIEHRIAVGDLPVDGAEQFEEVLAGGAETPIDEPVTLEDVAMIQYTSGTTGHPKGVMMTHGNITWNSINMMIDIDIRTDEISLLVAPLFHTAGMNNCFLTTVLKGGTTVMMRSWEVDLAVDLIERHRVTMFLGVPTMFQVLAQSHRWAGADFSSLRTLPCGSAPLPRALIETYADRGLTFLQGYGMTESSPNATFLRADRALEKVGSAGTPCFFSDLRIVDPLGNDVRQGEKGEVILSGPNVMRGYWEMPEASAETVDADGWLRSGDVAIQDEEGFVYIVDRLKNMIISGGENIYPAEVEDALFRHPAVADCAVVGVPDERWGEVGHAYVVLVDGGSVDGEQLKDYLRDRLAAYKVPRTYEVLDRLPRNASGKVVKKDLRERAAGTAGSGRTGS